MEEADFKGPPRANFLIAANHIRKVLDGQGVNWAAMGGLGMLCLGYRRNMRDIHVVYDERDRRAIYDKLEADRRYGTYQSLLSDANMRRVRFPKGMNLHFPTRILLRTGGFFNDVGCTENVEVEVNLIPPGNKTVFKGKGRQLTITRLLRNSADGCSAQKPGAPTTKPRRQNQQLQNPQRALFSEDNTCIMRKPSIGMGPEEGYCVSVPVVWKGA